MDRPTDGWMDGRTDGRTDKAGVESRARDWKRWQSKNFSKGPNDGQKDQRSNIEQKMSMICIQRAIN